jgi:hypothetical protein
MDINECSIDTIIYIAKKHAHLWGKMRVVRASDVAKLIAKPAQGTETSIKFGKIFEECYTFATYLYGHNLIINGINVKFIRKFAFELKENGIYSPENVRKAYKMYSSKRWGNRYKTKNGV